MKEQINYKRLTNEELYRLEPEDAVQVVIMQRNIELILRRNGILRAKKRGWNRRNKSDRKKGL